MNTFVVANPHKCIGCRACEIACAVAHLDTTVSTAGAMGTPFLPRLSLVKTPLVTMPIQCRQCDDAPCANVCPVQAITHRNDKILLNAELCIGCKTCIIACPFGAVDMVPACKNGQSILQEGLAIYNADGLEHKEKIIAHKCDLCFSSPNGPACVEVCPASAFVIIDSTQIKSHVTTMRIASALEIADLRK